MPWDHFALALGIAFAAALAYYSALRLPPYIQTAVWLGCSIIVAASPCVIPLNATPLRFLAALFAITVLVKLHDLHRENRLALRLSVWSYLTYLPNGFWLVLRRKPRRRPKMDDMRKLAVRAPAALFSATACWFLFQIDWSIVSFALEHTLKVTAVVAAVIFTNNAAAAAYRLLGGVGQDFMRNPFAANTPAEFWRRWNVPAQLYLAEYAFKPSGGLRKPVWATLLTFAVSGVCHEYVFGMASGRFQGWQFLFFVLQGCAAAATLRIKPEGPSALLWLAGTWAFNLISSFLFFLSVDQVLPFYFLRAS